MNTPPRMPQSPFRDSIRIVSYFFAFWIVHSGLRALLIFRLDPYGIPFVNKPDGYIFHAICIDFVWLAETTLPFLILSLLLARKFKGRRVFSSIYLGLQFVLLFATYLDHEIQRFMGCHLTFAFFDTYKDASSVMMFPEYSAVDASVPYLQFVVFALLIPVVLLLSYFLRRGFCKLDTFGWRGLTIGSIVFFFASLLCLNVIWIEANRMHKLAPVISVLYKEWQMKQSETKITPEMVAKATRKARSYWAEIEGEGGQNWEYPDAKYPLYRVPKKEIPVDSTWALARASHPNFIVIFLESHRGLDVGFLNPEDPRPSATPVLDSLASVGRAWMRMQVSGMPTVEGVLSSHLGFPPHRTRQLATELSTIKAPSYASIMRDSGYVAHFFSAADPAGDNLSVWFRKWYDRVHYNRNLEDDSTFFLASSRYMRDSLARSGKPFVAGLISRSNHSPFTLIPGMPDSIRALPQADRMRYTMQWTDKQVGAFLDSLAKEPWFKNTYIVVMADHGFPQGEHGVSTIGTGGYSNSTWIPFVITGPALRSPKVYDFTTSQMDIAPTLLHLAGIRAPNSFAGHDMLRSNPTSFALGVHVGVEAITADGFRLLTGLPSGPRDGGDVLFAEEDMYQIRSLVGLWPEKIFDLQALADTLLFVNDYSLSRNLLQKAP